MRWFLLVPVVLSLAAAAAGPDLANARVQGAWNITVTLAGYSGATPNFPRNPGVQGTDTVWFENSCPSAGLCTLRIWGPSGPDPSQAAFYRYYSSKTSFEGNTADQLLIQSGTTYANQISIGGFGGPIPCHPPQGTPAPGQHLTITVTDAKKSGSGWLATTITGTETLTAGWGCNGSQFTGWSSENLTLVGHPVGYVAPGPAPDRTSVVTVSSIASALNTPAQAFRSPLLIAANLVITAVVILFVTFPAALFNHTLSDNYEEIAALTRPLRRLKVGLPEGGRRRDAIIFGAVILLGAWINGQLDSQFGFNGSSVISYIATTVNICFGVTYSATVAFLYRRARRRDQQWHFRALPLGLLVAAFCVLLSRTTGFQPGYFYGLVVGIAFGTSLAKHEAGHTAAIASVATMAMAVGAWFAWAAVNPSAQHPGASWPLILLDDFLGSVFVGGLVGNVVGLLPLRSLQGGTLIIWRRAVWGVIFAIAVFGMVQVLLHPEQGAVHPSHAPLVTALLLFVAFAGGSLAFNRYFAWMGRPTRRRQEAPVPA